MVRALLRDENPKTQTRRVFKPQPARPSSPHWYWKEYLWDDNGVLVQGVDLANDCPHGQRGDRLWVKETFGIPYALAKGQIAPIEDVVYQANPRDQSSPLKWKPSIHMRRQYSRITLEITGVRVERLNEISAKDIISEGAVERAHEDQFGRNPVSSFDGKVYMDLKSLWASESINGKGSWANNPFCWVIEFKKL